MLGTPTTSATVAGLDLAKALPNEHVVNQSGRHRPAGGQADLSGPGGQQAGRTRSSDLTDTNVDRAPAEAEFALAMAEYKQRSGRMFPTWSEVLEVLQCLGYEKPTCRPTVRDGRSAAVPCG